MAFREYLTWGNYDIIVNTLQRVALTMSGTAYKSLFASVVGASLLFGIMGVVIKGSSPQIWTKTSGTIITGRLSSKDKALLEKLFIVEEDQTISPRHFLNPTS
ncbi:MAG: conjugal transfer protein TraG [Desulfobacterales bacterium]|nr:conjugal transfer protein TraG [Desulfobacterales bacterium]